MSAIAGVLDRSGGPVATAMLRSMGEAMSHRGPARVHAWASGSVGLCNSTSCDYATISQVSPYRNQHLRIAFDGRIDNAHELMAAFPNLPTVTSADQDAALVLAAYRTWGAECPHHLRGDFAFALWDERRRALFCARDCFGSRPLYYSDANGRFALASELRALRRLPNPPRNINEGRIADYLVGDLEGIDKVSTPFTDIQRLPPGHSMTVDMRGMSIRRYWFADPDTEVRQADPEDCAREFLSLLSQAVERCLRAAGPVSVMLSGGLDSTAIAALAGQCHDRRGLAPVPAVSGVNPADPTCLESRCVRMASGLSGIQANHVGPDDLSRLTASLDRLLYDADEYFDSWSMHIPLAMYARAQQLGHGVMLDGIDGDIATSLGPGYLTCLLRDGHWAAARRESRGLAAYTETPSWQLLYRHGRGLCVPAAVRRRRRRRGARSLREMVGGSIVNADFAARVDLLDRVETMRSNGAPQSMTLVGMHAAALNAPFVTVALERYDRLAAQHAIEARHPLLDRDLVEFCLSLPWDQKRRGGCRKWGLRSAMRDILPRALCWRTDFEHLGPQFSSAWFALKRDEMRDFVAGHVHEIEDYVSLGVVRDAHVQFEQTADVDQGFKVWQAFSLWSWLKRNA